VTSGQDGKFNGQIANSMFQVTSNPATIAISINKENYTHELIKLSRKFAVSILAEAAPMKMNAGLKRRQAIPRRRQR
jgi:flavin reductase (DIM6/NTAB) family NADH-FMN oxidoreductase RutF